MLNQTNNNIGLPTGEKPVISTFVGIQQGSPNLFNSMNKITGIYKITNPKGRIYIGQSINISKRERHYRAGDCKGQVKLYASIQKYGWDKHRFEILQQCHRDELNNLESYYIELLQCFNNQYGLNLTSGGDVNAQSDETRAKRSKALRGRIFTQEWKDKIGAKSKGRMIGFKFSEETLAKMRGRVVSEETRHKMSETRKRLHPRISKEEALIRHRLANREWRNRVSLKTKGTPTKDRARKVIDTTNGEIFNTITSAAKYVNLKVATLRAMLNGRNSNKTSLKFFSLPNY